MYSRLSKTLTFTSKQKQLLKNLTIDENHPGTILHDFDVLLTVFRESRQTLTDSHQLPLKLFPEINQRLKNPIQLDLKRPHPKSYPHIQGLYLLLRTCGLTHVDASGKKPVLVVEEAVYEQWSHLNPTERYCNLLETWFLRGYTEIIGERSSSLWSLPDNSNHIGMFLEQYKLETGLQVAGNRDVESGLPYAPGWHNLGLLELFGLIIVQSGQPQPDKGRYIEKITLSPAGTALLALLYSKFFNETIYRLGGESDLLAENFQKTLHPYFPKWKNRLIPSEMPFQDGTHIYKVSLGPIWRRIAIGGKQSLDQLASAILESVQFDSDHLYDFRYHNRFGKLERVNHPYMDEGIFTTEVLIGELPLSVGQTMTFVFDYGDYWEFSLLLEAIEPKRVDTAKILETHGEAPEQYPDQDYYDDEDDFEDDEVE